VLKASRSRALDWDRFKIYDQVLQWFGVIAKVPQGPVVMPENVWNIGETGTMLSKLISVKGLVSKDNQHGYGGAREERTLITAIECVSASGKCLDPMVIWPAATHRASWTTHLTHGWHYTLSDSGYMESYLILRWLKLVFDPKPNNMPVTNAE
jgi:hypothetical protein